MLLEHTTASHLVKQWGGREVHEEGEERRGEERKE
jgi:hypothetical protein